MAGDLKSVVEAIKSESAFLAEYNESSLKDAAKTINDGTYFAAEYSELAVSQVRDAVRLGFEDLDKKLAETFTALPEVIKNALKDWTPPKRAYNRKPKQLLEAPSPAAQPALPAPQEPIPVQIQEKDNSGREIEPLTPKGVEKAITEGNKKFFGADYAEKFFDGIKSMTNAVSGFAKDKLGKAAGAGKGMFDKLKNMAIEIGLALAALIGAFTFFKGWDKAIKWFGENADIGDKLASAFANMIGSLLGFSEEETKKFAQGLSNIFHKLWEFVGRAFDGLKDMILGLVNGDGGRVIEGFKKVFSAVVDGVGYIVESILSVFVGEDKAAKIVEPLKAAFNGIIEVFQGVWNTVQSVIGLFTGNSSLSDVFTALSGLGAKILSVLDNVVTSFLAIFGLDDMYQKAKDYIGNAVKGFISGIIDFVNGIIKYIPGVPSIPNPYKGSGSTGSTSAPAATTTKTAEPQKVEASNTGQVAQQAKQQAAAKEENAGQKGGGNTNTVVSSPTVNNSVVSNTYAVPFKPQVGFSQFLTPAMAF